MPDREKVMRRYEICATLEEVRQFFYSCYQNADGEESREHFQRMMCGVDEIEKAAMEGSAVDEARKELMRDE